jgi:hypothetical protein
MANLCLCGKPMAQYHEAFMRGQCIECYRKDLEGFLSGQIINRHRRDSEVQSVKRKYRATEALRIAVLVGDILIIVALLIWFVKDWG